MINNLGYIMTVDLEYMYDDTVISLYPFIDGKITQSRPMVDYKYDASTPHEDLVNSIYGLSKDISIVKGYVENFNSTLFLALLEDRGT